MIKLITFIFIIGIFNACSIKDVSKPILKYTIDDNTKFEKQSISVDKILKISNLKSPKYLQNNSIWYKKPSYETSAYLYSAWNEDFVDLIEKNIASSIYDSALFKSMFTRYSKIQPDLILEGEIIEAKQIINSHSADIKFSVRLYLIDTQTEKLIGSKEFSYLQKCEKIDAKSAILTYNSVVKNLNKDVVKWLKLLVKES